MNKYSNGQPVVQQEALIKRNTTRSVQLCDENSPSYRDSSLLCIYVCFCNMGAFVALQKFLTAMEVSPAQSMKHE